MATKLTLFELHFDGAKFGGLSLPSRSGSDEESDELFDLDLDESDEESSSSGRGIGRYVMLLGGIVALGIAGRQLRGRMGSSDDDLVYVEEDEESELEVEN